MNDSPRHEAMRQAAGGQVNAEISVHLKCNEQLAAQAKEIAALRAVMRKHYPTIAGHAIRLQAAHEDRAAAEWIEVAQDFYMHLGESA